MAGVLNKVQHNMARLLKLGAHSDKTEVITYLSAIAEQGYVPTPEVTGAVIEAIANGSNKPIADLVKPFMKIFLDECNRYLPYLFCR